ncbi:MAG TPA: choice-of-anchor Q domain-containing protein [Actinomycetota bacterium]|nr:choice-of-anchor Q domain-containing protein [Actinomycetota bacterium]
MTATPATTRTAIMLLLALTGGLLGAAPASANTLINVDTLASGSADGCTLHEAITTANTNANFGGCVRSGSGTDEITFSVNGQIELDTFLPQITQGVIIRGPGADSLEVRRAAVMEFGIFDIGLSATSQISGLTISNGRSAASGGGIRSSSSLTLVDVRVLDNVVRRVENHTGSSGVGFSADGGGVWVAGALTIYESTIMRNRAEAVQNGTSNNSGMARGGCVYAGQSITLRDSTVSGNVASAEAPTTDTYNGSATAEGGGVFTRGGLIETSTIDGNLARATQLGAGGFSVAHGGGIRSGFADTNVELATISGNEVRAVSGGSTPNEAGGGLFAGYSFIAPQLLSLVSSTVAFNTAADGANLMTHETDSVKNTILSDPREGPSCSGTIENDLGFNLMAGGTCGNVTAITASPQLLALQDNGGPTKTHNLRATSPAIDKGDGGSFDQRGEPRPVDLLSIANALTGDGSDIGAFEKQDLPIDPRCEDPGVICGTQDPDVLIGTSGPDLILGFGGKDTIRGGAGNDRLIGGAGNDRLYGGSGKDRLEGGSGRDYLHGGPGRDRCSGGPGKDTLRSC